MVASHFLALTPLPCVTAYVTGKAASQRRLRAVCCVCGGGGGGGSHLPSAAAESCRSARMDGGGGGGGGSISCPADGRPVPDPTSARQRQPAGARAGFLRPRSAPAGVRPWWRGCPGPRDAGRSRGGSAQDSAQTAEGCGLWPGDYEMPVKIKSVRWRDRDECWRLSL